MKEATADTIEPGEDAGINSSPDASPIVAEKSDDKSSLKREYPSDDDDQRPLKVRRVSATACEKTVSEDGSSDGDSVISSQPCETSVETTFAKAGCSKYDENSAIKSKTPSCSVIESDKQSDEKLPAQEEEDPIPVELMNLSDDVLLIIMSFLKPTDLCNLSLCCQRLYQVASDWSLWIDVDFRPHSVLPGQLERTLRFLNDTTERIATRGLVACKPLPRWRTECLSSELLSAIAAECPYLRSFIAEEHCIDAKKVQISAFPVTIEHLSLKGCEILNTPSDCSYFNSINRHLPNLKVLELSDCAWFRPHSIMALSKLPYLEELHLDGCYLMKDCIAYTSLAFTMGFVKLKILDLRRTGISDSELSCFNRNNRLTHLYLEYPPNSNVSNNSDDEPGGTRACHLPGIISDLGLRSLVISDKPHVLFNNAQFGINSEEIHVMAPLQDRVSLCKLHTLVARNFSLVTDATLNEFHFAQSLRYLDLTGTHITRYGVEVFRSSRPDVTLVTSFDSECTL